jgi:uncharacterized protein (TIGR03118 family)
MPPQVALARRVGGSMKTKISLGFALAVLGSTAFAAGAVMAASAKSPPAGAGFEAIYLVSNHPGLAANYDPDLVNAWGISHAPGSPLWVSDNGTNKSTLYDRKTGQKVPLTVEIRHGGAPTGNVFVPQKDDGDVDFPIQKKGASGPSIFIFVTEAGTIQGWNPNVDLTHAVVAVDRSAQNSVFKGVALGGANDRLFAADFSNNEVEVFDDHFHQINAFTDTSLPKRFAPFNVALINGKLYVAFARRERGGTDEVDRRGLGYVDVFSPSGNLLQHLIANGPLDAPWGMTIAPQGFGAFSGALLVGNFGNGGINAFDPNTGEFLGAVSRPNGNAIKIDGLWGLDSGPDGKVTFAAGPNDESDGLVGLIEPASPSVASR